MIHGKYCSSPYHGLGETCNESDCSLCDYFDLDSQRAGRVKQDIDSIMSKFDKLIASLKPIPVAEFAGLQTHCMELWRKMSTRTDHEIMILDVHYLIAGLYARVEFMGVEYEIEITPVKKDDKK